ncbi:MAG: cysteine hydrolase [Candidatus Poribacteria bacterium]|nr:cysteine hydrolase [Candidatus Poribacteria bacterium]MDE0506745.1 cysteine hydrolase [Candidatus Poribacteria bacterium]
MARQVFVDIDTQYDFVSRDGALSVPGAEEIRGNLKTLTDFAVRNGIKIVASADAHVPDDKEFEVFPPHCVQNTPGQKKIEETTIEATVVLKNDASGTASADDIESADQVLLEKQTYDVFTNPSASGIFEAADGDEYIVYGVATDYCVKAAAVGLLERGYKVTVVKDAIAAVAPETGEESIALMEEMGAGFKTTHEIVGR